MITEQDMKHTNIRYSITLNDGQLAYLSDDSQGVNRMMCLRTFLGMAVMEQTTVTGSNFSAGISAGQFIASKVELGRLWNCDRKTATRIIGEFNRMGILKSEPTNRTTVHTLRCLSVWFRHGEERLLRQQPDCQNQGADGKTELTCPTWRQCRTGIRGMIP